MKRSWVCLLVATLCAAAALCNAVARGETLEILNSAATAADGTEVVLNDCYVDTDGGEWLSSQFVCELAQGSFFQLDRISLPAVGLEYDPWAYYPEEPVDSWLSPGVSVIGPSDGTGFPWVIDPGESGCRHYDDCGAGEWRNPCLERLGRANWLLPPMPRECGDSVSAREAASRLSTTGRSSTE